MTASLGDGETSCPGCGLALPVVATSGHAYLGASPSCWALFGEVLAREYGDPRYMAVHRLTVDAYAAQHPGISERRTIQSINIHLLGLHLALDRHAAEPVILAALRRLAAAPQMPLTWPEPPRGPAAVTVADVVAAHGPVDHAEIVHRWAQAVWSAWAPHHAAIGRLAEKVGGDFTRVSRAVRTSPG